MRKKKFSLFILAALLMINGYAQQVGINEDGSLPNPNAILDIKSFNKGVLIPRMSTSERVAIPNTRGLIVYDTTTQSFWYNTGSIWKNMSINASTSAGWLVTGNAGTIDSNFIGTTDDMPLRIKVNNKPAGLIGTAGGNTFLGVYSGAVNPPHYGFYNTGYGMYSLFKNTTGSFNTAIGNAAMYGNTTGSQNTAVGNEALLLNSTGINNTSVGRNSLTLNTTGSGNTATGNHAMYSNTVGSVNTADGVYALYSNTTGNFNTAVGPYAINSNTGGGYNTAMGYYALQALAVGDKNTCIGSFANVLHGTTTVNSSAIGYDAVAYASNRVRLGNSAVTSIEGAVCFTTPSDGRYKYKVQEDVKGLDFILKLRPVTYNFDAQRFDEEQRSKQNDSVRAPMDHVMKAAYTEAANIRRSGFIAQEVERAAAASGYDFSGLNKPQNEQDHYALSYESFVVPMVKAIQELNKKLDDVKKENESLKKEIQQLQKSK